MWGPADEVRVGTAGQSRYSIMKVDLYSTLLSLSSWQRAVIVNLQRFKAAKML